MTIVQRSFFNELKEPVNIQVVDAEEALFIGKHISAHCYTIVFNSPCGTERSATLDLTEREAGELRCALNEILDD